MNWLLMSRAYTMLKQFSTNAPENVKSLAVEDLQSMLAKSINILINKFKAIDNIVMIADGGSWRKSLKQPSCIKDIVYKGNRKKDENTDWDLIFNTLNEFMKHAKTLGITTTQDFGVEGDDWAWYWSRKLNEEGINCMIWTSDNDLKQLVQYDGEKNVFTAWYNDQAGLWFDEKMKGDDIVNAVDFFMAPIPVMNPLLEDMKRGARGPEHYINPFEIVLEKILMGDAGDNIKPVARYIKNGREFKFSNTDFQKVVSNFTINNIDDLLHQRQEIAEFISNMKKFKPYNISPSDIVDMIVFNVRLVWLNDRVIPPEIREEMTGSEYKSFDLEEIRSNYKMLTQEDTSYIENLFETVGNDDIFNDFPEND
jgi:5'-3' exonuclease